MSSNEKLLSKFIDSDSINDDILADIIAAKLNISKSSFKVKLVLITSATKPNENYGGFVLRLSIKYHHLETAKSESINVIAKVSLDDFVSLNGLSLYEREKFVYESVLSKFEQLWLVRTGETVRFAPKGLKFTDEPAQLIILEDLKAENYELIDRKEGLSLEQAKTFLSLFAKYHAAGAVTFQKDGTLADCLDRNHPLAPKQTIDSPMSVTLLRLHKEFVKALRNYGDCDYFADKIEQWDKLQLTMGFLNDSKPMACGLQVLNHGDIWTNNIMFKFNSDSCLIIDFQLCFWGSPAYDILVFLAMSIHDDIKVKHFSDLIEFYFYEFRDSLEKLKYEHYIPSLDEFSIDIMEKGYILAGFLPMLFFAKYSSQKEFSFEQLMTETDEEVLDEIYDRLYNDEYFIKAVKSWLPFLDESGFLNTLIL